jgi:hypothetical protein
MMRKLWQVVVYLMIFCVGFVAGLYTLPILTAPPSPSKLELATHAQQALYSGEFKADLAGSDALW